MCRFGHLFGMVSREHNHRPIPFPAGTEEVEEPAELGVCLRADGVVLTLQHGQLLLIRRSHLHCVAAVAVEDVGQPRVAAALLLEGGCAAGWDGVASAGRVVCVERGGGQPVRHSRG